MAGIVHSGIWPYVPVVSRIAWFSSNVPKYSSIMQIGLLYKHKLASLGLHV